MLFSGPDTSSAQASKAFCTSSRPAWPARRLRRPAKPRFRPGRASRPAALPGPATVPARVA